jgi:hypothetical protein
LAAHKQTHSLLHCKQLHKNIGIWGMNNNSSSRSGAHSAAAGADHFLSASPSAAGICHCRCGHAQQQQQRTRHSVSTLLLPFEVFHTSDFFKNAYLNLMRGSLIFSLMVQ